MVKVNFKPARMNTVNPYLMVNSVPELVSFIEKVFNGKLAYKLDRPGGAVMHAEIKIGDSIIMAGEPTGEFSVFPCSLYIYVEDCDKVYQEAVSYGCKSIMPPATMRHAGERYGGIEDKNGNIWWIATHVEDLTPDEQAKRIIEMKEKWED